MLPVPSLREAQGQAAVLLVESLIHCLIERKILTVDDALDVIGTAMEVQKEVAEAADGAGERMWQSYSLLAAMSTSLKHDGAEESGQVPE